MKGSSMKVFTRISVALCLLIAVTLSSACKSEGELKGDVFIVTNGAQNFKLGLVEIHAIPEKTINAFLSQRRADALARRPTLQEARDEAKKSYQNALARFDSTNNSYEQRKDEYESTSRFTESGALNRILCK
jgi:hypothetical protein